MNTLTLDKAKTIVCSSTSSASALAALQQAGFDVWQSSLDSGNYGVYFDSDSVGFLDCTLDGEFYVFFNSKLIHPAQRHQFLESQQQQAVSVPAVPAVEARPTPEAKV